VRAYAQLYRALRRVQIQQSKFIYVNSVSHAHTATPVKSAQRIIEIFELYAARGEPATLTSIASALKMPKSSCLALLTTLASNGYLYEVRQAGYYPTRRWLDKAQAISANDPLAEMIRPVLAGLRETTGETLIFGKLSDERILYIEVVESWQTLRYTAVAGQFKPLHGTASGKAALSALPAVERKALIAALELKKLTPRTITDASGLERDIEQGLARGWHVSRGENVADATAIAVPVLLMKDIYVLVVAGPAQRMEPKLDTIGARLCEARREIEKR
jgi:DNA-binding IclR family transcriptional regulator